jgi:integrase
MVVIKWQPLCGVMKKKGSARFKEGVTYIPLIRRRLCHLYNVRTGLFEYHEFIALRNALPYYLQPVVTMAHYTGMRKEEILSLTWDQVDLREQKIILEAMNTKNNEPRIIYMDGESTRRLWSRKGLGMCIILNANGFSTEMVTRLIALQNHGTPLLNRWGLKESWCMILDVLLYET